MTTNPQYEYDIFLSHNHADEDWTARLAEHLEQEDWRGRKLRVFFSPWDIRPGQTIPREIENALSKSRKVGLVLSPEAMNSAWVELERLVTIYIAVSAREERLIPLYRRMCEIPTLLQPILYVDFRDDDKYEESYQRFLAVIKDEPLPRRARVIAPDSVPALSSIPRPPGVGFVSRQDVERLRDLVEQLKEELAPEKQQVVALWGVGGIGKTTLAAETAREMAADFAGGIVWTSAYARADFTFTALLDEIAAQLGQEGLRTLAPDEKAQAVSALVSAQPTLIVLDNFETIKPDEKARCIDWLKDRATCPALITTREKVERAHNINVGAMSDTEAEEFLNRLIKEAQEKSAFTQAVRKQIIETAEANPYVMEWVFAQIDLADDPKDVFADLAHGKGKVAERVFDRSYNLPQLGDDGRAALLALALFVPDASRDALSQAAGFGDDPDRVRDAIKQLGSLRLIVTKQSERGRRIAVEGLTRSLAQARLDKDAHSAGFRQRFVASFLNYAKGYSQPKPEDFDELEVEKDNILSAMDKGFGLADWAVVMQLMDAINFDGVNGFLMIRGYWDEAIRRGEQALKAARNLSAEWEIGRFTHNLAITYQFRGELAEARRLYEESLEIKKRLGNQNGIAGTLHQLATLAQDQGELAEARRLYEESLEIEKSLGDQSGIASTLHQLGRLAQDQGELAEARRLYEESLEINKRLGDQNGIAGTLHQLATLAQDQGELAEARRLYEESLGINKRLGNQNGIAISQHQLGRLAQDQGELAEARRLYEESLEINKRLGDQSGIAISLHQLATLAQDQGELAEARRLYEESLEIKKRLGNQSGIAGTLHQLGRLAQDQGELAEARRLYEESLEINKRLGDQNGIAISQHQLGRLAQDQGELAEARRLYEESLKIKKRLGDQNGIALTLGQLGGLAEVEGNKLEAVRLFREALGIFERLGSPYAEVVRRSLERVEGKPS